MSESNIQHLTHYTYAKSQCRWPLKEDGTKDEDKKEVVEMNKVEEKMFSTLGEAMADFLAKVGYDVEKWPDIGCATQDGLSFVIFTKKDGGYESESVGMFSKVNMEIKTDVSPVSIDDIQKAMQE